MVIKPDYIARLYIFYMFKEITVIFCILSFLCHLILQTRPQNYFFLFFFFPVIKCLPVQEPENGRIIMTGAFELGQEYSFGQVVNFECNAKYKLVGAKEIVCSANGEWSSDVPQCKGKKDTIYCLIKILCSHRILNHGYHMGSHKVFTLSHSN